MIGLALVLLSAAPAADVSIEQLFTEHRCLELEALWFRSPDSAHTAYFVGMCRMQAGEMEAAEEAFDRASSSNEWVALASFMRGLTRLRQGRIEEAKDDLQTAMARPDLPAEVGASGRELMGTVLGKSVHGAITGAVDYDTNALLLPLGDNSIGLSCAAVSTANCRSLSAGMLLSGVGLWDPTPDWSGRLVLLQRQVLAEPTTSISAALLDATHRAPLGRFTASYGGGVSGYLLATRPFLASVVGKGALTLNTPGRRRLQASAALRWQQFGSHHEAWDPTYSSDWAFNFAPLTGADAFLELEGSQPVSIGPVPFTASAGLTQGFFWTRGSNPDAGSEWDRNVSGGWVEVKWSRGDFSARGRVVGEVHLYRHRQFDESLGNRRDIRGEVLLSGSWVVTDDTSLDLDTDLVENLSNYAIYQYPRELVRLGVTRAF